MTPELRIGWALSLLAAAAIFVATVTMNPTK
jgi:hypothetical protein